MYRVRRRILRVIFSPSPWGLKGNAGIARDDPADRPYGYGNQHSGLITARAVGRP